MPYKQGWETLVIKKGETATCGGVQIPVEAFGAWSTLRLYIQKIVYGG